MTRSARWLSVIAAVIVLPVAAAGVGIAMIDPNDYKPQIIAAVRDKTGRVLSLNGPLRVTWSLWPKIEVSDVKLANLPGGSRPDMARAERISARLSLLALLHHRIEVTRLILVGPNILFEQVDGKPNWVFAPQSIAGGGSAPTPSAFSLRIRQVVIQNGMVTSRLPPRTKVVGIRSLDLRHATDGGPLDLDSVLIYQDNQPFHVSAVAQPTAGLTGPWTSRLSFAADGVTATAQGTADVAGRYDLQVEAKAVALERLNALLPSMRLPALHQLTLATHLTHGSAPADLPVIGTTKLQFATADLQDRVPGLTLDATTASLAAAGDMATVDSTGHYAAQPFTLHGQVAVPTAPDGRVTLPFNLKVQSAPGVGSLALDGKLTLDKLQFAGLDTTADLRTPAMAALRPMVTQRLPALTAVQFHGAVAFLANAASVSVKGATLQTHEGDLSGDATFGLGTGLSLTAQFKSNELDLDAILAAAGRDPSGASGSAQTGSVIPDTPLPWAVLRGPAIDLSGDVGTLGFAGQSWRDVAVAFKLAGGRIERGTVKLALSGGPLAMSVTADAAASAPPVSLTLHAPGVPLALIARYAGLPGPTSGTVRVDAELRSAGRSAHDLAASLDGPVSAAMVGGEMGNAAFDRLAASLLDALGIKVPAKGDTAIHCLGLSGSFSNGVGRFPKIALDTTYLQFSGRGEVDLGRETVAFKINPLAQVSGSAVSVPVLVEGPFRAIKGRLDADGLDKLGLMIDGWFGGDHPDTCSDAGLAPPRR